MISPKMLKIIEKMPEGMVVFLGKKILGHYINKYAHIEIEGMENIKDLKEPSIYISNHLSNADALIVNRVLKNKDLTFVAGVKLGSTALTRMGLEIVKTIPIKPNTADKESISNIIQTIKNGDNVCLFPEGTRSRTASMIEAKKGILLIAKLTKAPIVPIGICGTEKLLPIDDKDMGGEKFQHADIKVNIGKPINLPKKYKDEDRKEYQKRTLDYIMTNIAVLLPESYRGIYENKVKEIFPE